MQDTEVNPITTRYFFKINKLPFEIDEKGIYAFMGGGDFNMNERILFKLISVHLLECGGEKPLQNSPSNTPGERLYCWLVFSHISNKCTHAVTYNACTAIVCVDLHNISVRQSLNDSVASLDWQNEDGGAARGSYLNGGMRLGAVITLLTRDAAG